MNPVFNWVGSKRSQREMLSRFLPKKFNSIHNTYFEPFGGSGALMLYLEPFNAVFGDIDSNVVRTFKDIKSRCFEVASQLD